MYRTPPSALGLDRLWSSAKCTVVRMVHRVEVVESDVRGGGGEINVNEFANFGKLKDEVNKLEGADKLVTALLPFNFTVKKAISRN
jgi:hypothetical protein